jgi:hypothetical protein
MTESRRADNRKIGWDRSHDEKRVRDRGRDSCVSRSLPHGGSIHHATASHGAGVPRVWTSYRHDIRIAWSNQTSSFDEPILRARIWLGRQPILDRDWQRRSKRRPGGPRQRLGPEEHVVFKTWDYEPIVSWKDEDNLLIQITTVSRIDKSLHKLGDMRISYRISETLSEEKFLKDQADYEQRALVDFRNHKSTFVGDPKRDVEILKEVMASSLKSYKTFQAWAKENVE